MKLHAKYAHQGLEILAFPCNQFGAQEPGSAQEIKDFTSKYKVKFTVFEKVRVNGKSAHPVFAYLKKQKQGILGESIKWNFAKFLVNRQGEVVARYAPTTKPMAMEKDIKACLQGEEVQSSLLLPTLLAGAVLSGITLLWLYS